MKTKALESQVKKNAALLDEIWPRLVTERETGTFVVYHAGQLFDAPDMDTALATARDVFGDVGYVVREVRIGPRMLSRLVRG